MEPRIPGPSQAWADVHHVPTSIGTGIDIDDARLCRRIDTSAAYPPKIDHQIIFTRNLGILQLAITILCAGLIEQLINADRGDWLRPCERPKINICAQTYTALCKKLYVARKWL